MRQWMNRLDHADGKANNGISLICHRLSHSQTKSSTSWPSWLTTSLHTAESFWLAIRSGRTLLWKCWSDITTRIKSWNASFYFQQLSKWILHLVGKCGNLSATIYIGLSLWEQFWCLFYPPFFKGGPLTGGCTWTRLKTKSLSWKRRSPCLIIVQLITFWRLAASSLRYVN